MQNIQVVKCSGLNCASYVEATRGSHVQVVSYTCDGCKDAPRYGVENVTLLLNGQVHDDCSVCLLASGQVRFSGIDPSVYLDSRQTVELSVPCPRTASPEHEQLLEALKAQGWSLTADSLN